jgi:DNA repair protein RadC
MSLQNPAMDEEALTDTSDIELLAAVFDRGTATRLMERFGNLRALLHAESEHLLACTGIGRRRLRTLQVLPELAKRYYSESLPCGESIRSPADTEAFLQAHLRHLDHEVFCLCFDTLFRGTIDGTSVYPREVVKEALAVNAAAIILAHNHPSGVAEPSQADERITRRLKSALELVDIRLLDHLIIGDGRATSLASRGLL